MTFTSPTRGAIALGWEGPLLVDGESHALDESPRYDNPFVHAEFGRTKYKITYDESSLLLDFKKKRRKAKLKR